MSSKSLRYLIIGFVFQLFPLFALLNHTSDSIEFLNRYSKSYGAVIVFSVVMEFVWLLSLIAHRYIQMFVSRIPERWNMTGVLIVTLLMLIQWMLPIESSIKVYFATNYMIIVVVLTLLRPDSLFAFRRWQITLMFACILILPPLFITSLSERIFKPDEAQWADYASSSFLAGGIYSRTWLQEPVAISPGLGWSISIYGWGLKNIDFNIYIGRVLNFVFYILTFGGIATLTWRIYGRSAAIMSTTFAVFSTSFVPVWDYRPDHQLAFASTVVLFTAVQARRTSRNTLWWHFSCGLLATLALQLHAAAVVFAFGCSLFYLVETISNLYHQRKISVFWPLVLFGIGAFIGTLSYYIFNIHPLGGLDNFLVLLDARGYRPFRLRVLAWPSLPEAVVIISGFAYLLWRRNATDRLFLGLLSAILLSVVILDREGYYTHHNALYIIPIGVLIADGVNTFKNTGRHGFRSVIISWCITAVLIGQISGTFILWNAFDKWFRTGNLPPFLYQSLQPVLSQYVRNDDIVVSTHQLIWTLPYHPILISYAAEQTAMKRWGLTNPVDVWNRVKPTLIIDVENEMLFNEGLLDYIQQQDFQICDTLDVMNSKVRLYRVSCS